MISFVDSAIQNPNKVRTINEAATVWMQKVHLVLNQTVLARTRPSNVEIWPIVMCGLISSHIWTFEQRWISRHPTWPVTGRQELIKEGHGHSPGYVDLRAKAWQWICGECEAESAFRISHRLLWPERRPRNIRITFCFAYLVCVGTSLWLCSRDDQSDSRCCRSSSLANGTESFLFCGFDCEVVPRVQ
jgi:hypothetical protein